MHESFWIIRKFIVDNLEKRVNKVSSFLAVEKTTRVFGNKQWGKVPIEKVLYEKLSKY
jgi:hypothetical protein